MQKMMYVCAAALVMLMGCKSEIDNKPAAKVVGTKKAPDAKKSPDAKKAPDTKGAAKAPGKTEAPKPKVLSLGPGDVKVSPSSKIEWVGAKVTGDHKGGFKTFEGKLTPKVDGIEAVEFIVDTTSLYSDSEMLTGHLKNPDFFDVAKYPQASFISTKIEAKPSKAGTHEITGDMTMHGVTKTIAFPAKVAVKDGKITADSEFTIMRFDFGLKYPGKVGDLIKDEVLMKIHLEADAPKKG